MPLITMKDFETREVKPLSQMTAKDIQDLRRREGVSQSVFGRYFNLSKTSISHLERGTKGPSPTTLKLLNLVKQHGIDWLK